MVEEAKKTEVQVVDPENKITVSEKELEKVVARIWVNLEKKDYRATVNVNTNQQQVPDAMTEFVNMKEEHVNDAGFNRDLDVKGTISPFQLWKNKMTRIAVTMSKMHDWRYIELLNDKNEVVEVPVDLAQIAAEEERWLMLSLNGLQSEKEIRLMRAGFGLNEETMMDKGARWFGLVKKKKSEVYGNNYNQGGEQR